MHSPYTSSEFYHFVGFRHPADDEANFEILSTILQTGSISFAPDFPSRPQFSYSYNWDLKHILDGGLIVREVTCFADIPRRCLGIHTRKYGRFGLSFARSFLVKKGARSVMYVPLQSSDWQSGWGNIYTNLMVSDWIAKWQGYEEFAAAPIRPSVWKGTLGGRPENKDDAILAMDGVLKQGFLAFIKVFDSDLPESDPRNYYMEREWRVPNPVPFTDDDVASIVMPESYAERFSPVFPQHARSVDTFEALIQE